MTPFYWRGTKNFGDYLNSWLWPELFKGHLDEDGIRLIGIGSLLKDSLNFLQGKKVIFGTGSGYGSIPPKSDYKDWIFYFVRGPLTAKCFELENRKAIVDGAWLISLIPRFQKLAAVRKGTAFIPHWTTADSGVWASVCDQAGFHYIDPQEDLFSILDSIANSELVITESLHGAILADYFRTPWIPVRMSPQFLPFKWVDWFQSVELEPVMHDLGLSDLFEHLYWSVKPGKFRPDGERYKVSAGTVVNKGASRKTPGLLYSYKLGVKRQLRALRRAAVQKSLSFRNISPVRNWNARHQAQLQSTLKRIAANRPLLSSETTRCKRIDQLASVTDKLRKDLELGRLTIGKSVEAENVLG